MNDSTSRSRIVVGVDGTDAALTAVRYAAAQAHRLDADLDIVHASPVFVHLNAGPAGFYPLTPAEYRGIGLKILAVARKAAQQIVDETTQVHTTFVEGPAGPALTSIANRASGSRMLVLGDQRRSIADRLITGSVVNAVAGTAAVPVVVVPESWTADRSLGVIAVGVQEVEDSEELLRTALAIAADRGARLRVLHAWQLPMFYDDLIVGRIDSDGWSQQIRSRLDDAIAAVHPDHPEVPVQVELIHEQPARALVEASSETDLLLLSRHRHGLRHLGSTGRAVLRECHCPVEVVLPTPHDADHPAAGRDIEGLLEDGGEAAFDRRVQRA